MKQSDYVYMIYDTRQADICVAQFDTCKEVADYFNTTVESIHSTVSRLDLRKKRYRIERVELEA